MVDRIDPNAQLKIPVRSASPANPRIQPGTPVTGSPIPPAQAGGAAAPSFASVLQQATQQEQIKFSAHAQERLQASRVQLSSGDIARISDAVSRAAQKGARESLVLMSDLALVVSVRNRTVITAVEGQRMKENIFTNIDSAVIL